MPDTPSRVRFDDPDSVTEKKTVLIHMVEDGFSAHERVWYRGQELEYEVGSPAYQETQDRNGHSWLGDSDAVQMRRYGRVMFRPGPWPGYDYTDDAAREAERLRRRVPPVSSPIPASARV